MAAFARWVEEPLLLERFGAEYEAYRRTRGAVQDLEAVLHHVCANQIERGDVPFGLRKQGGDVADSPCIAHQRFQASVAEFPDVAVADEAIPTSDTA
jgi:hypothetical protein